MLTADAIQSLLDILRGRGDTADELVCVQLVVCVLRGGFVNENFQALCRRCLD